MPGIVSIEYLNSLSPVTATNLSATNSTGNGYAVILGGTIIPLPTITSNSGFTPSGTGNTTFTVNNAGTYFIRYEIHTTASLSLGISSTILVNGSANTNLTLSGISGNAFSACAILPLTAGTTLQMQLSGLIATATLSGGCGANLTVVRVG